MKTYCQCCRGWGNGYQDNKCGYCNDLCSFLGECEFIYFYGKDSKQVEDARKQFELTGLHP